MGLSKHPDLPNLPLVMNLASSDEERAIFKVVFARQVMAWPFAALWFLLLPSHKLNRQ